MDQKAHEPKHFAYIDAVRGYAFLGVLLVHCAFHCGPFPGLYIFQNCNYGVQLFFLASAITLCSSMASRGEGGSDCARFYIRRFFRIAPLFWLSMVVYWSVPDIVPRAWFTYWAPNGLPPSYFVLTALFLHGWHPYTFNSIVPGGWSIAVEMTFYAIFPLLFRYITNLRRAATAVLAGFVFTFAEKMALHHFTLTAWPDVRDYNIKGFFFNYWFPSQVGVFLIGIFSYYIILNPAVASFCRSPFCSRWLFGASLAGLAALFASGLYGYLTPLLIVSVMAAFIVSLSGRGMTTVVNPLICYLGKLSYSGYLTHFAALALALRFLDYLVPQYRAVTLGGGEIFQSGEAWINIGLFAILLLMTLAGTVLFSIITYRWVESPGIALGKKIIRCMDAHRSPPIERERAHVS